ncbi:hypothetical protein AcW1_009735 [Taiwanofungus camphoratus]|nr:hypothetical protein AcV5_002366 [Antrodia cinnamomea]KAI0918360.1 hypothetical protein AcV5_002366 [Antrodia cinnamomea]KAI0948144.1 hypothetical protein AcW1_009735 [Antrodia cinnamomea]
MSASAPAGNPLPHPRPTSIPGPRPPPISAKGGSGTTMFAGMAIVTAGLYAFWRTQFHVQGKRNSVQVEGATHVPSWQLRMAQQQLGTTSSPSSGIFTPGAPEPEPKPRSLPLPDNSAGGGGMLAEGLTRISGKGSEQSQADAAHVAQPAARASNRTNDRGGIYTKNSDYKDGYKRQ